MARTPLWTGGTVVAGVALLVSCAATSAVTIRNPDAALPDGVAVAVTLAAFKDGFRMCSRPGPWWVTSYWEVPPEDVQRVDAALLAYLRNAPGDKTLAYKPEKFTRQYAGFRKMGRRFIYVNAFPSNESAHSKEDPSKELLIDCDGGDVFWGIEYDVQRRAFGGLETNGAPMPR
jgi:hypothetical protein